MTETNGHAKPKPTLEQRLARARTRREYLQERLTVKKLRLANQLLDQREPRRLRRDAYRRLARLPEKERADLLEQWSGDDQWFPWLDPWNWSGGGRTMPFPNFATPGDRKRGDQWPIYRSEQHYFWYVGRSRYLCRTNAYARGLLRNLTNYVIGSGFKYKAQPREDLPDVDPQAAGVQVSPRARQRADEVQKIIDEFGRKNQWPAMEKEAFRRVYRDGEAILRYFEGEDGKLILVRWVEPEQVRFCPAGESEADGWSYGMKHAIGADEDGEPYEDVQHILAYHVVYKEDQANTAIVDADEILHIKDSETDSTIKRGFPFFSFEVYDALQRASALQRAASTGEAVRQAIIGVTQYEHASMASIESFVAGQADGTVTNPATGGDEAVTSAYPHWANIPKGQTFQNPPTHPGTSIARQVTEGDLLGAAVAACAPGYMASGEAGDSSYAGLKEASAPFIKNADSEQEHFKQHFLKCVRYQIDHLISIGELGSDTWDLVELTAEAPVVIHRDPLQQAQVATTLTQAGLRSRDTAITQLGDDPRKELAKIDQEQQEQQKKQEEQMRRQQAMQPPGMDGTGGMGGAPMPRPGGPPPPGGPAKLFDALGRHRGYRPQKPAAPPGGFSPDSGSLRAFPEHRTPNTEHLSEGEKFERCVQHVKADSDVDNPWAVCHASMKEEEKPEGERPDPTHDDPGEDPDERADAIAELLLGLFGDDAEKMFDAMSAEGVSESLLEAWNPDDHPRIPKGKPGGGRFIPKNSPEAVSAAKEKVAANLKGEKTPEGMNDLMSHLNILTTKQIHDLRKEYQLSASGKDKASLVAKIADRLHRGRREEPAEKPKPAQPPAAPPAAGPEGMAAEIAGKHGLDAADAEHIMRDAQMSIDSGTSPFGDDLTKQMDLSARILKRRREESAQSEKEFQQKQETKRQQEEHYQTALRTILQKPVTNEMLSKGLEKQGLSAFEVRNIFQRMRDSGEIVVSGGKASLAQPPTPPSAAGPAPAAGRKEPPKFGMINPKWFQQQKAIVASMTGEQKVAKQAEIADAEAQHQRTLDALNQHGFIRNRFPFTAKGGRRIQGGEGWVWKNPQTGRWENYSNAEVMTKLEPMATAAPQAQTPAAVPKDFTAAVHGALDRIDDPGAKPFEAGDKHYIASVYDHLKQSGQFTGTLDDFKDQLLQAHRAGKVQLSRLDLVQETPKEHRPTQARSQIGGQEGDYHEFHLVRKP